MIDLHTHTIFSDGELIPAELARRAVLNGYKYLAITDHADSSNIDFIIPRIVNVCNDLNPAIELTLIPGIEITHVPPKQIAGLVTQARKLGAKIVVVHGETIAEPVSCGTNRAAIEAGVDILAHPGIISDEDTKLAAQKGVLLELSARKGHSLSNGHVADIARRFGASLSIDTDAHAPGDLFLPGQQKLIAMGAGLKEMEFETHKKNLLAWLLNLLT